MPREVLTPEDVEMARLQAKTAGRIAAAVPEEARVDTYSDRLLKYIPTEVVSVYLLLDGLMRSASSKVPAAELHWSVFAILAVMTPFYLRRVQHVRKRSQLAISTISFAVWVFSLGGPFAYLPWYEPVLGSLVVVLYTFLIPLFEAQSRGLSFARSRG